MYKLAATVILASLFLSNAHAYEGQPKSVECTLFDGHPINFDLPDVPADKLKLRNTYNDGTCSGDYPATVALANASFDSFYYSRMGCKRVNGKYRVTATYMQAGFYKDNAKGKFGVFIIWGGKDLARIEIEQLDKNGDPLEKISPDLCKVTAVH